MWDTDRLGGIIDLTLHTRRGTVDAKTHGMSGINSTGHRNVEQT